MSEPANRVVMDTDENPNLVRRSQRVTKGQPPNRYGEKVFVGSHIPSPTKQNYVNFNPINEIPEGEVSYPTGLASFANLFNASRHRPLPVHSNASSRRSQQEDLRKKLELSRIAREEAAARLELKQREREEKSLEVQLDELENNNDENWDQHSQCLSSDDEEIPQAASKPVPVQSDSTQSVPPCQQSSHHVMQDPDPNPFAQYTKELTAALLQVIKQPRPQNDNLQTLLFRQSGGKDLPIFNGEEGNW